MIPAPTFGAVAATGPTITAPWMPLKAAARPGATPTQVALAWLMARPGLTAPIASATSLEQLQDLMAAANLPLDQASLQRLDQASSY